MCLEVVFLLEALAQDAMVVDLAVDGEGDGTLIIDQWLRASVCTVSLALCISEGLKNAYRLLQY